MYFNVVSYTLLLLLIYIIYKAGYFKIFCVVMFIRLWVPINPSLFFSDYSKELDPSTRLANGCVSSVYYNEGADFVTKQLMAPGIIKPC